jgi:N6-adenosine-specific RNA methylase IME4
LGFIFLPMKILQELESLIPPLSNEEFKQLERNILEEGIREPLITWNGILIDGHNRFRIAQEHDMNYETLEKEFENINRVKEWMINNQFGRRNLSNYQRSVLALHLENVFKDRAKEKEFERKTTFQKSEKSNLETVNSFKEIGKVANVSHDTIAKVKKIEATATPEVKEKLNTGQMSINEAYKEIKKEEKIEERKEDIKKQLKDIESGKLPELWGKFEVIAIDPPWAYEEKGGLSANDYNPEITRGATPYPTMTLSQIKDINLPLTDNSVVFLWTTHAFLKDAFDILEHWNLKYKATLVWDKEKMGMGRTIRLQCEFCLIAFKGNPIFNGSSERDIIREARREHSRKPDAFYQYVERSTIGRKLEYFSREKRTNWEIYGNEVNKF